MERLGELATRLFSCIAGYEHLAGRAGKCRLAVCKVTTGRKAFVTAAKVATVFTRCKAGVVAATKATVIRATGVAVIEARTVSVVVALGRCRTALESAATVIAVAAEEFGLTPEGIAADFAFYHQQYNV